MIHALLLFGLLGVYLGLIGSLNTHLSIHHKQTWRELGEPQGFDSFATQWRELKFIFLGGAFKLWNDPKIRLYMRAIWISFAIFLLCIAIL